MNKTNEVIGAVTRHALTGGGVAGVVASHDQIVQAASLAVTVLGLIWSIIEKIRRPASPPPTPTNNPGT